MATACSTGIALTSACFPNYRLARASASDVWSRDDGAAAFRQLWLGCGRALSGDLVEPAVLAASQLLRPSPNGSQRNSGSFRKIML